MKYDYYITGTIGEEFDWWTGQRGTTHEQVKEFLDKNKDKEINIAVSSPGGYLSDGIAIAELIAAHGNCNMIIVGMTASAATVLCMKAKSVKIARGSLILIHNSSKYVGSCGLSNKQKIDAYIEELKKTRENLDTFDKAIADIYSLRNHKSIEENCSMMDKEKWMTSQEAVDFGIVDEIIEEEEIAQQSEVIKNVYASYNGIENHFDLPQLPKVEKPKVKVPKGVLAKLKDIFNDMRGIVEDDEEIAHNDNINQNPTDMNKKFITVNALLNVEGLNESADGVVMTVDQMQVIEDNLAELQGKVENLGNIESQLAQAKADKETAESAKADAEKKLAELQKEFEDFKNEAGDDTVRVPVSQPKVENAASLSSEMFNQIKDIL